MNPASRFVSMVVAAAVVAAVIAPSMTSCAPSDGWRAAPMHGCCGQPAGKTSADSCTQACRSDTQTPLVWKSATTVPPVLTHRIIVSTVLWTTHATQLLGPLTSSYVIRTPATPPLLVLRL